MKPASIAKQIFTKILPDKDHPAGLNAILVIYFYYFLNDSDGVCRYVCSKAPVKAQQRGASGFTRVGDAARSVNFPLFRREGTSGACLSGSPAKAQQSGAGGFRRG